MTLPPLPQAGQADYINLMLRGGYPEIRRLDIRARNKRYRDAVDAIVDRDVADVLKVRKSDALRRLIDQVAARTANELNIDALCSDVGVRRETMMSYLDALTRLSLVARLGAWAKGSAKREIKRPKLHLLDTGIIAALRGLNEFFVRCRRGPDIARAYSGKLCLRRNRKEPAVPGIRVAALSLAGRKGARGRHSCRMR